MTKLSKRRIKTLSKSKKTMKKKTGGIRFPRLFNRTTAPVQQAPVRNLTNTIRNTMRNLGNRIIQNLPNRHTRTANLVPVAQNTNSVPTYTLNYSNTNLTTLPELPASLKVLYCNNNPNLTNLPELPASLKKLYCSENPRLTGLSELPASLEELDCSINPNITSLPTLPASLEKLNCFYNELRTLPKLPASLEKLNCAYNDLTKLLDLPASLEYLDCSYNPDLITLPDLPTSLKKLYCSDNNLTELPDLPNSLEYLNCSNNPDLRTLPDLPTSLTFIDLDNTPLPEFNRLPDNFNLLTPSVQNTLRRKLRPIQVNPNQVHQYSSKINIKQLIKYFKDFDITPPDKELDSDFIKTTLTDIIEELITNKKITEKEKNDFTTGLTDILRERLTLYNMGYQTQDQRGVIYYSLKFVLKQNDNFKKTYIETFIKDCIQAYEGPTGMSCVNGVLERIYLSLVPASVSFITEAEAEAEDIKKYEELIAIIEFDPKKLVNDYTLEWFKMHKQEMKDENSEFKKLEKSEKLENLRTFLLSKLPDASKNTIKLIDEQVKLINDDKYNELKDESDFYGGKRKRRTT